MAFEGLESSLQRCKGSHCAFVYMRGVEYPVYAKVVKDLDVHVYPKTKKGADGTKPGCVFFASNSLLYMPAFFDFSCYPSFRNNLIFSKFWIGFHRARVQFSAEVRLLNVLSRLTVFLESPSFSF